MPLLTPITARLLGFGAALALVPIASHSTTASMPFCADHHGVDIHLRHSGFIPEDSLTFSSGAKIIRYRFLGDFLWVAQWPGGKECLMPMGDLDPSRVGPKN